MTFAFSSRKQFGWSVGCWVGGSGKRLSFCVYVIKWSAALVITW